MTKIEDLTLGCKLFDMQVLVTNKKRKVKYVYQKNFKIGLIIILS